KENDEGFSLVELLIVVIIMGVLAAIAIPLFLSQRAKAEDAKTEAIVETMGKELATWWTDNYTEPTISVKVTGTGTAATGTFHLLDTGESAIDENLVTPIPKGFKVDDAKGVWWDYKGSGKTNWCFWAFDTDGKNKYYVVSATKGLRSLKGAADMTAAGNAC
ncbi:MAG: type II secretion system GspH family protein, partial [Bifidobacteriaceae bacterium]|nr:type II secretion system GspH family protein [Bifidobacteriaceae bacterium]